MQRLSRFLQGPFPYKGEEDPDLINAGEYVSLYPLLLLLLILMLMLMLMFR